MRSIKSLVILACFQLLCGCPGGGGGGDGDSGSGGTAGANAGGASGASGMSGTSGGSSGASGSAGNPSTGLPSGKALSSLTATEAQSTCETLQASFDESFADEDLARYSCTLLAVVFSLTQGADGMLTVDQAACEQMVTTCVADAAANPGTTTEESTCTPAALMTAFAGCTATAGELESCFGASLVTFNDQLSMLSCDAPVSVMGPGMMMVAQPAECVAFEMECPGVLDTLNDQAGVGVATDVGGDPGDGEPVGPGGCSDNCPGNIADDFCDDGGDQSETNFCAFGTDCTDCGPRP